MMKQILLVTALLSMVSGCGVYYDPFTSVYTTVDPYVATAVVVPSVDLVAPRPYYRHYAPLWYYDLSYYPPYYGHYGFRGYPRHHGGRHRHHGGHRKHRKHRRH